MTWPTRMAARGENALHQFAVQSGGDWFVAAAGQHNVHAEGRRFCKSHGRKQAAEMAMPQGERLGDALRGVLVNADDHDVARHRAGMPYAQLPELGVEKF